MVFLRFLGWVFIPYIMIFARWNKVGNGFRVFGSFWAFICLMGVIQDIRHPNRVVQPAAETVVAATNNPAPSTSQNTTSNEQIKQNANIQKPMTNPPALIPAKHAGRVGNIEVTVNSLKEAKSVGDDLLGSKANGTYWIINITVKNDDNQARTIDSSLFQIEGDNNTKYSTEYNAETYANNQNDLFLNQLNPGVTMSGNLVFDMPDAPTYNHIAQHYDLLVDGGFLSTSEGRFALP